MIPNLPAYACHKKVRAARITEVVLDNVESPLMGTLFLEIPAQGGEPARIHAHPIAAGWIDRYRAEIGGYLVVYEDGYVSYSPAKSFEEGYARLVEGKPVALAEIEDLAGKTWTGPAHARPQAVLVTDSLGHNPGCSRRWNYQATCTCGSKR